MFKILCEFAIINTSNDSLLKILSATTQKANIVDIILPVHDPNNFLHVQRE